MGLPDAKCDCGRWLFGQDHGQPCYACLAEKNFAIVEASRELIEALRRNNVHEAWAQSDLLDALSSAAGIE